MFKRHWLPTSVGCVGLVAVLSYGVYRGAVAVAPAEASNRLDVSKVRAAAVEPAAAQAGSVALAFRPEDGQVVAYRYEMRSLSDVDVAYLLKSAGASAPTSSASAGERQRIEISAHGTLNFKFYATAAERWNVGAKATDLVYLMGEQPSAESGAMAQPFAFSFGSDGTIGDFAFAPGVSLKAQAALKQILSWFQVVVPKEARVTWSGRETDATGTFQAQYALLKVDESEVSVSKKKLSYLSLATALTSEAKDTLADIVSSKIDYQLSRSGKWFNSAKVAEKLSLGTKGRAWGKVDSSGSIQNLPEPGAVSWPATFDAFRAEMQASKYLAARFYETDPTLDALWSQLNMSSAVERFMAMWSKERRLAEALMVNFLRQKPSRSTELVRLLDESTKRDNGIDETTRLTLWRLNAKAGHKEAQKAQMDAALNPASSRKTRMNALAHLDFENPEPFVVEQALKLRRSSLNATDRSERELGSMALLSLGALGDPSHPNQAMNDTIARKLVGYLDTAKAPADTVTTLQAIGNSGNTATLDAVKPYLKSSDESIRVSAIDAVRRMDSPQAAGVAVQSFEQNMDTTTRAAALRSLSTMPASVETMAWGRTALSSSMAEENLAQLAAWLGSEAKSYPENAAALRQLLHTTTSFEVKKAILKYISP